jgi:fucose permease
MITWQSDQFPLIALVTAGLFLGPIFPNTSSWVARKTPDFPGGTTLLMLAIMGGGFAFPPVFGYLIEGKETSAFAGMILPLLILSVFFFYLGNRVWKSNTEVAEKD